MITRIEATNYRCFDKLAAPMDAFNVLAGANGSGKTTLLDIPVLLGDLLKSANVAGAFMKPLLQRGARASSLGELLFRGLGESFVLAIEAALPPELVAGLVTLAPKSIQKNPARHPTHVRYELRVAIHGGRALRVKNEYLFTFPMNEAYEANRLPLQGENAQQSDWRFIIRRDGGRVYGEPTFFLPENVPVAKLCDAERSTEIDDTLLGFARLQYESAAEFPCGRWLLDALMKDVVFLSPEWEDLRKPSQPGLPEQLMASGENIPWLALRLKASSERRFGDWVEHVQTALPQISEIDVKEREEDHHAYFRVTYEGGFVVTSSGLSEGTLRILALTLIPYVEKPPSLLIVEQPEDGIHPQAIEAVMQSLRSLYDGQVWVSTHSPIVLADRKVDELLLTRLERDGSVTVTAGPDHPRLAKWKGALDLGTLFATGVFE